MNKSSEVRLFEAMRRQAIEEDLKEAKVIVEALKVVEDHCDEFNESLKEDFEKVARKYDIRVEELEESLKEF